MKLYEAINGVVDNITLQDLVNRQKAMDMEAYDYMI
jgi:DNA-binding IscR family transcriptional regulator